MGFFARGLAATFGHDTLVFGAAASTVSSLSRARLFCYDRDKGEWTTTALPDGCVGIVMQGDVQAKVMVAQGAKPVTTTTRLFI